MGLSRNGSIFYNKQLLGLMFVGLVSACQYAASSPSLWPFMNQKFCADKFALGVVTSLYYLASAMSSPIVAYIYRRGVFRAQGIAMFVGIIISNLFYAQAEQMDGYFENGGLITIGIARFAIGFASCFMTLTMAWIGEHGAADEQQSAVTCLSAMWALGFTIGSAIGGLTAGLNFHVHLGTYIVRIDKYTAPAYLASMLLLVSLTVFLWVCRDCEREAAATAAAAALAGGTDARPHASAGSANARVASTDVIHSRDLDSTPSVPHPHSVPLARGGIHSTPALTQRPHVTGTAGALSSPPPKRSYWAELRPVAATVLAGVLINVAGMIYLGAQNVVAPVVLMDYGLSVSGLSTFMTARGVLSLICMFTLVPIGRKVSMGKILLVASFGCVVAQATLVNVHWYSFETTPAVPDEDSGCAPRLAALATVAGSTFDESLVGGHGSFFAGPLAPLVPQRSTLRSADAFASHAAFSGILSASDVAVAVSTLGSSSAPRASAPSTAGDDVGVIAGSLALVTDTALPADPSATPLPLPSGTVSVTETAAAARTLTPTHRPRTIIISDATYFPVYFAVSLVLSVLFIASETTASAYISRLTHGTKAQPLLIGIKSGIGQVFLCVSPLITTQVLRVYPSDRYILFIFLTFLMGILFASSVYIFLRERAQYPDGNTRDRVRVDLTAASCGSIVPTPSMEASFEGQNALRKGFSSERLPLLDGPARV